MFILSMDTEMGTEVLWYKNIGFGFVNAERQMGEYVAT
jgi:hypothetical protein